MKAWLLSMTCVALYCASAMAQDTPPAPQPAAPSARTACKGDYQKFCSGVPRGGGRILDCLNSHKGELTTACQEAVSKAPPKAESAPDPNAKQ